MKQQKQARSATTERKEFNVGDRILLRRIPDAVRSKLGHKSDVSGEAYAFSFAEGVRDLQHESPDPDNKHTDFSFSQPVNIDRLTPFELSALEVPGAEPSKLRPRLRDRFGNWKYGDITHQSGTGKVGRNCEDGTADWHELTNFEHDSVRALLACSAAWR